MKVCGKCKELKLTNDYCPDKSKKDGKSSICRECHAIISNEYYYRNRDKSLKSTRKWMDEHKDVCLNNKRAWKKANPDKVKAQYERWRKKNPEKVLAMFRGYSRLTRETVKGKLVNRIGPAMAKSLRKGKCGRPWESLVGYTVNDLRKHIEKQFAEGMSWDRFDEIHIDHKIPLAAFNFEKPEDVDFKRAWDLKNLRPMWAKDNISKGARLQKPFQPSLPIGG